MINYFYVENAFAGANQLTFTKTKDVNLEYSSNGSDWIAYDFTTQPVLNNLGDKLYFRGTNQIFNADYISLNCAQIFNAGGDLTTLLDPNGNVLDLSNRPATFYRLFGDSKLKSIMNIKLPSTTLSDHCYFLLFAAHDVNISELTDAPKDLLSAAMIMAPWCYAHMFQACDKLRNIVNLPATTLANTCYRAMFLNCRRLEVSEAEIKNLLPAKKLAPECYLAMFQVSSINKTPDLPATELAKNCYTYMFSGCPFITTAPELPATTLVDYCYCNMFEGCTSLVNTPILPATTLTTGCYSHMFALTKINTLPNLPATTLAPGCYDGMFGGCQSISNIPNNYLPVKTLTIFCYKEMFSGCSGLVNIDLELPATTLAQNCYRSMFSDCKQLKNSPKMNILYPKMYSCAWMFQHCENLEKFPELPATTLEDCCYLGMFIDNFKMTVAPVLPATELANGCYDYMFKGCKNLTTAPELPATSLKPCCYAEMFRRTGITTAPKLPATVMQKYCYSGMFMECPNLINPPELPAMILARGCYGAEIDPNIISKKPFGVDIEHGMFEGCTALTKTPIIRQNPNMIYCYNHMFKDCTNLWNVRVTASDWNSDNSKDWLVGTASKGLFECKDEIL